MRRFLLIDTLVVLADVPQGDPILQADDAWICWTDARTCAMKALLDRIRAGEGKNLQVRLGLTLLIISQNFEQYEFYCENPELAVSKGKG